MSINQALAAYSPDGCDLASNDQVASLFNAFGFGGITWDIDENTGQNISTGSDGNIELVYDPDRLFVQMFGQTCISCGPSALPNLYEYTAALFGRDADRDSSYNFVRVSDDFLSPFPSLGQRPGGASMSEDDYHLWANYSLDFLGVALVRVPEPPALLLFLTGILGLGITRINRRLLNPAIADIVTRL